MALNVRLGSLCKSLHSDPNATVALQNDDGLLREFERSLEKGSGWRRLGPVWPIAMQ